MTRTREENAADLAYDGTQAQHITVQLENLGLDGFEVAHALDAGFPDYGGETVLRIANSVRQIRCPAYPQECDYVRITVELDSAIYEIAYWTSDEWASSATDVMGAILGAANS